MSAMSSKCRTIFYLAALQSEGTKRCCWSHKAEQNILVEPQVASESNHPIALSNNNLHFFSQHARLFLFSPPRVFTSRSSWDLPDLPHSLLLPHLHLSSQSYTSLHPSLLLPIPSLPTVNSALRGPFSDVTSSWSLLPVRRLRNTAWILINNGRMDETKESSRDAALITLAVCRHARRLCEVLLNSDQTKDLQQDGRNNLECANLCHLGRIVFSTLQHLDDVQPEHQWNGNWWSSLKLEGTLNSSLLGLKQWDFARHSVYSSLNEEWWLHACAQIQLKRG